MSVDVLLGQAYFLRFDPSLWRAARPYAPLGALYAAAFIRERGYAVQLFDAMLASSVEEWDRALDAHHPRIAVIYEDSFNYLSKMCLSRMREAALAMTVSARRRGATVLVAGSDATDHPEMYLRAGAAAVIVGEGEVTLVHVIDAIVRGDSDWSAIDGVVFSRDSHLVRTSARPIMRDLDRIPKPAWDLVDVDAYRSMWLRHHGFFSMNIATTRGCPYHCNWCAKPIYGQRYTARSPEAVAEEIAWLKASYAPDHLWVTDDIFGLKPGWIDAFATAVAERNAVVPFKCLMRADGVTEPAVQALVRAGCQTVWIGAESGSQRVLDAMEKGTTVSQIESAARLLHAAGVEMGFFLQFGYPGETMAEIDETLAMVARCRPDDIGISVSYPLPGTPFHERVGAQLGEKQNWVDSADLAMMYQATYSPDFYRTLHRFVHARFRASNGLPALRRLVRCPYRARKRDLTLVASAAFNATASPVLGWRVRRLAKYRVPTPPTPRLIPLLSPQAASLPSEQRH